MVVQDAVCNLPYTYLQSYVKDGTAIPQPTWIAFSVVTQKFTMTTTNPSDVGVYIINTTAEIPQIDLVTGVNRKTSYSFTLTVRSDCVLTSITDSPIVNMSNKVS